MDKNKRGYVRYGILLLFCLITVACALLFTKVGINYDITKYLSEDTETKISLEIIENEFGMTGNVQVMIDGIEADSAKAFAKKLSSVENVLTVSFDPESETSYKDGKALYNVLLNGSDASLEAKKAYTDIKALCDDYENVSYGGTTVQSEALRDTITTEMVYILGISLALVAIILLITSSSWIEPFILLFASGFAVVINLGTNIIFGEISYITSSVAAILQLALSIDYSIVLLHTYRAEKEITLNSSEAMSRSVKNVIKPVSASALTTVAGLIALLFMTFRIGFDIGIVLIKGIVISAFTSLTLLPALILVVEKPMMKLKKKEFVPKGSVFCSVAKKAGAFITPIALAVVIVCGSLQSFNSYSFTANAAVDTSIQDAFGKNSTVILVYKKSSDSVGKEKTFTERLSKLENSPIKSITAYSNTVMEEYSVEKAVSSLGVSEADAKLLYTMYYLEADKAQIKLLPSEFAKYVVYLAENDDDVKNIFDANMLEAVGLVGFFIDFMNGYHTANDVYAVLSELGADITLSEIKNAYDMLGYDGKAIEGRKLIKLASKLTNYLDKDILTALGDLISADEFLNVDAKYDYIKMSRELNNVVSSVNSVDIDVDIPQELIFAVYAKYSVSNSIVKTPPISAKLLLEYVSEKVQASELLSTKLDDSMKAALDEAKALIANAENMFIGVAHNRLILSVDLPTESDETDAFVQYLSSNAKSVFGSEAYLAGEMVSTYDLKTAFDGDNRLINTFTIISVFVIVMLIFRSLALPVILVTVIQGAIWIALSVWLVIGDPLFFMSFIMGNCILMGATIDYGILMSSNYVLLRKTFDKREALQMSVKAAMPTVFSSGMIMTVCGFVIGNIASQNAIASTGIMIGIGTIASVVMITVVLPSALYVLDGFIMKLSLKNNK